MQNAKYKMQNRRRFSHHVDGVVLPILHFAFCIFYFAFSSIPQSAASHSQLILNVLS